MWKAQRPRINYVQGKALGLPLLCKYSQCPAGRGNQDFDKQWSTLFSHPVGSNKESSTNHLIHFRSQWSPSELIVWASFRQSQIETSLRHNHSGYSGNKELQQVSLKKKKWFFSFELSKGGALNSSVNIVIDALKEKEKISSFLKSNEKGIFFLVWLSQKLKNVSSIFPCSGTSRHHGVW